jgi:hypothetical protein
MIVLKAEAQLLQVVDALRPPRRLACRLYRRQQQSDQNANDGNHDEQLDQRKRASNASGCWPPTLHTFTARI